MRKKLAALSLLFFCMTVFFFINSGFCQQADPSVHTQSTQEKESPEKIIPSSGHIRESVAVYVFIAWMWLVIFILVFLLRQKINEVDRLHRIRFFPGKKE